MGLGDSLSGLLHSNGIVLRLGARGLGCWKCGSAGLKNSLNAGVPIQGGCLMDNGLPFPSPKLIWKLVEPRLKGEAVFARPVWGFPFPLAEFRPSRFSVPRR